jgi:pimeloyl-ACP methyl ester carboxylesterase
VIVLVHGVPETGAIWDGVRARLPEDAVALWLPGFGCARPEGFGATMDDYAAWLVGELESFDEPVDLIGHDWGALLTFRIATAHGRLIRSWVADVGGALHPDYVWHDVARIWQAPGDGEALIDQMASSDPAEVAPIYEGYGVPADEARRLASWMDETMGGCILPLYRSAVPNPAAHWMEVWGATTAPGLVLAPSEESFVAEASASAEVAGWLGARHQVLDGVGHWWPLQAPDEATEAIVAFHASVR